MKNILLTLSYDGTDFCGWQRQDSGVRRNVVRTVQGELEDALCKMLKTQVSVQGSGRTDSGVHATAQAATFFSPHDSVPVRNYCRALNGLLPPDIRVMDSMEVPGCFSARFSATSRTYRYVLYTGSVPPAYCTRYVWHLPYRPCLERLNAMASVLRGELDCATFCASGDQSTSTFRCLHSARFWYESDERLLFEIEANAFLWKMVRSVLGTLIQLEHENKSAEDFAAIVHSRDRSRAGITAPPSGLFLHRVNFDGIRVHP